MKIKSLTNEQQDKFPEYVKKWKDIGLSTRRCDRELCQKLVADVYKVADLEVPTIFIWLRSPREGAMAAAMIKDSKFGPLVRDQVWDQVGNQVWDQVGNQVGNQVWDQVVNQVWDQVVNQVGNQVGNQVRDQVRDQVGDQVWAQVGDQVGDQVWAQVGAQVGAQVWAQVGAQVRDQVGQACYGTHDSEWLAFYDFFANECGLKEETRKLQPLLNLSKECGWFWPFKGLVIFTERPTELHFNDLMQRHKDGGAAIAYEDGFSIYALNGVNVSKEQAETPVSEFTKEMILGERNVDVRRELVRKVGIEKTIELLGAKVVDTYKDYELLLLDLGDKLDRPYLKMKNPSIDAVHIEGVRPEIRTVKEALAYRNGLNNFSGEITWEIT